MGCGISNLHEKIKIVGSNVQSGKGKDKSHENQAQGVSDKEEEELVKVVVDSYKSLKNGSSTSEQITSYVCNVCHEIIPPYQSQRVEFWNHLICQKHLHDGTNVCSGCLKFESTRDKGYVALEDGRLICSECSPLVFEHKPGFVPITKTVFEFYNNALSMHFPSQVPVLFIDREEMRKQIGFRDSKVPYSVIFGLTKQCDKNVTHVVNISLKGGNLILDKREYQKQPKLICLALCGLPNILTGMIVGHELMHAWFRLRGIDGLPLDVEEGICQVMGYKWLEWYDRNYINNEEEKNHSKNLKMMYKDKFEKELSPNYGDGFRKAINAVQIYGLRYVVHYIVEHKTLPTFDHILHK